MVLFGSTGKNARLLGTALLIITFVAGALAGAAAARVVSAERPEVRREDHRGLRGGPRKLLLDSTLVAQLGLSEAQRTEIRAILDRRDREAKALWKQFEPQLSEFGRAVHDEIEKVLTPEQQQKLDTAIEQRRHTWKQWRNCAADSAKTASKEKQP